MKPNHTVPSEAGTSSDPIELTMDAFRPVESLTPFRMDSKIATEKPLPYAEQDPRNAVRVTIKTPDGSYVSNSIRIDETMGEIIIDADGIRILLDRRNVVVYPYSDSPAVYPKARCDVRFTA